MQQIKRSVCPLDCPDTCSILATVEDGRVVRLDGDPEHQFTRGFLCGKVAHYPERLYSRDRLLYPMKRAGAKGAGEFDRISWEEAIDTIATRLHDIVGRLGGEAVLPYSYGGTLGIVQRNAGHRFFHRLGASRLQRTICSPAATLGYNYTIGASVGTDPETIVASDYILIWGQNTAVVNLHLMPFIKEARFGGARFVVIDPYRNDTARLADSHIAPTPGTDAALALGMMHVLITERLVNVDYIERCTVGYEQLRERVLRDYPVARVAAITSIPEDQIVTLAREYGRARAPFIRIGDGLSRHANGGMTVRTIACLPGLVGAFSKEGGGALQSTSGFFNLDEDYVRRPETSPDTRQINMVRLGEVLTSNPEPPVAALYVYHSNPAAVAPDQSRVLRGLSREDLFTVVHEQVRTDTVDYADIALPATTFLEHGDLYKSYGHLYLQQADPVIPPVGEARSNLEVFQLLAHRMGFCDGLFRESIGDQITGVMSPRVERLCGVSRASLPGGLPQRVDISVRALTNAFPTPSGKLEFYSHAMLEAGLDPLPGYTPCRADSETGDRLHLIAPPSKHFLNSTFGAVPTMVARARRPTLLINPQEAAKRGISDGDMVTVGSDTGEISLYADVTDDAPPGVVVAASVWWQKHSPGGKGVNHLTSSKTTDMAGGSTFHCNLVTVARR
jgi:anaerobic selenocysteine-containing dehydrogenase